MMKMRNKILRASFIDDAIVVIVAALIHALLALFFETKVSVVMMAILIPLILILCSFMPLLFKNASIGMKIMKLQIVYKDNTPATFLQVLIRQLHFYAWCCSHMTIQGFRDFDALLEDGLEILDTRIAMADSELEK